MPSLRPVPAPPNAWTVTLIDRVMNRVEEVESAPISRRRRYLSWVAQKLTTIGRLSDLDHECKGLSILQTGRLLIETVPTSG